ncbi:DUF2937 family protein [Nitratireductor basaltis]|uniref:DUF2937 family protein n=1 Tax=Nitratireductor basaltis TaxID=472175 RepID=A0A084U9C9_9HYPH|nr:DUF2937 family protein [Nitratireductor basaltis]KFB09565.1 hypothetical protein EL18_00581 [Nitratireductor basaltis]
MKASSVVALAAAIAGGGITSQAPEFSQQYRQRLHGALDEMRAVVERFDADAAQNGLQREEALQLYMNSQENFLRDRGVSMQKVLERHESLEKQAEHFSALPPAFRPAALLRVPDRKLMNNAWRDFEPAVPLTPHGLIWAFLGAVSAFCLIKLVAFPLRKKRRKLHAREA